MSISVEGYEGAGLPKDVGCAVQSVGQMRRLAKLKTMDDTDADEVSADGSGVLTPNRPVEEPNLHRLKWVTQVSEYWPLSKLASLSEEEMLELTADKPDPPPNPGASSSLALGPDTPPSSPSSHTISSIPPRTSCWRTNSSRRAC